MITTIRLIATKSNKKMKMMINNIKFKIKKKKINYLPVNFFFKKIFYKISYNLWKCLELVNKWMMMKIAT